MMLHEPLHADSHHASSTRRREMAVLAAAAASIVVLGAAAQAQTTAPTARATASDRAIQDFWTPKRLLDAKPFLPRPGAAHRVQPTAVTTEGDGEPILSAPGAAPTRGDDGSLARRLHPPVREAPAAATAPSSDVQPMLSSSTGAHFTTTRVFPDAAVTTSPYRIVGKLFAYNPNTRLTLNCSAAVLRARLVVTAGHCIYHAGPSGDDSSTNRYFYTNLNFVPSYNNGAAPLGSWTYSWGIVAGAWANGGGTVPNSQDVAILEMNDKNGQKISAYTGYFGYSTGGLSPNHLTILGYPCNIDSCSRMQSTGAGSYASGGNNTVIYGSAQGGGTSGGPWVQDFGVAGSGAPTGVGKNILRSVSSYGPSTSGPLYLGASILLSSGTGSFGAILQTACAHKAGNC